MEKTGPHFRRRKNFQRPDRRRNAALSRWSFFGGRNFRCCVWANRPPVRKAEATTRALEFMDRRESRFPLRSESRLSADHLFLKNFVPFTAIFHAAAPPLRGTRRLTLPQKRPICPKSALEAPPNPKTSIPSHFLKALGLTPQRGSPFRFAL